MEELFLKLLNMSITAGWLIIAIMLLRLIFKKAPKAIICFLWSLVGIRLIFPFSFKSVLSLIPSTETVPQEILYSKAPTINSGISSLNSAVNPIISSSLAPNPANSINPMQVIVFIASIVWVAGIIVMLLYTLFSYIRLYIKTKENIEIEKNIRICDRIDTPFIFGVIRPKIYLPSFMNEEDKMYVIAHEKAHIKRRDYLWKPLGFLLLTVYWFNPIVWVAYILLCRDIELACDEKVIKEMGTEYKKSYSTALFNCSVSKKLINACPLAFGEVGVKNRIKTVLNYKKPAFWIIIISVIVSIGFSVCFLTNPQDIKIYELEENEVGFSKIFTNVDRILLTSGETSYTVTDKENLNDMLKLLKTVKIKSKPLSLSRGEDRDKTYRINFGASDTLCFSKNYSSVWIYTGVKPTYSYKVMNPSVVKSAFDILKRENINSYFTVTGKGSDIDGFSLNVQNIELNTDKPYIEVVWQNDTDEEFVFGDGFDILYYSDGKYKSCLTDTLYSDLLGYILKPHGTHTKTYYVSSFNLSKRGNYRFKAELTENKYIWFDFELNNTTATAQTADIYGYRNSPDSMMPIISLIKETNKFHFRYSGFSSYMPSGTYAFTDNQLILTTDDNKYKYIFDKSDKGYAFNSEKSSAIPEYKYGANSKPVPPVPNGALFELFAPSVTSASIIDGYNTDIDGDGKIEHCALFYGPTMGIFTFNFSIWEGNELEYSNTFSYNHADLFFEEDEGKLKIKFNTTLSHINHFDISLENGNIILSQNGEKLNYFKQ